MRSPGRRLPLTLLLPLLVLAACSDTTGPDRAGVDLDRLFAPPTPGEVAEVQADWASRTVGASGVSEPFSGDFLIGLTPARLRVFSHLVDGHRHYGAVVARTGAAPGSLPVVVYAHGGDTGVSIEELGLLFLLLGPGASDFAWVVPSFRSETLRAGGQIFRSEGLPSPWDRDVDDALALVAVALQEDAALDPTRVGVIGFSRGAGVGLLMAARDAGIGAVVAFFGPTDFFDPWVREIVSDALEGRRRDLPGLRFLDEEFIQPLRRGQTSLAAVRRELLRRSPVHFASRLPAVQIHHGTADAVVAFSQAERLDAAMRGLGRGEPGYQFFAYTGAGHNPLDLPGGPARAAAFLQDFVAASPPPAPVAPEVVSTAPPRATTAPASARGSSAGAPS